jgi:hypothetical protein
MPLNLEHPSILGKMEFAEYTICEGLYKKFDNQLYKLKNTFVFNWESDFFSMSADGYFQEVEIKISKADFLKDFEKEKHKYFQAYVDKKEVFFISKGRTSGSFICEYEEGVLRNRAWGYRHLKNVFEYNHEDYLNGFRNYHLEYITRKAYAPATSIRLVTLSKSLVPNKFWYCVPEQLITQVKDMIPDYAGLLKASIGKYGMEVAVVKKAPFVHKNKLNLNGILLGKFYHKSLEQERMIQLFKKEMNKK